MTTMTVHPRHRFLARPLASPLRWPIVAAAVAAAVAHIPVISPHLEEAPYMGALFIVLTVACLGLAAAMVINDSAAVYAAAAVTCGLAVVGYAATRLVAFPMLADDVGNWLEPLGVVSIVTETIVVVLSVLAMRGVGVRQP
jgi:heme/copper-type cytochrome/quinol oxidase subunit 4